MLSGIDQHIYDRVDDFLTLLSRQLQKDQLVLPDVFPQDHALRLFQSYASILGTLESASLCPPRAAFLEQFESETKPFFQLLDHVKRQGLSPYLGLQYCSAIQVVMRELITGLVLADEPKLKGLNLFYDLSRVIALAMVDACEGAVKDLSIQNLEKANLTLVREKATYKNIFDGTSNLVLITDKEGHIVEANPEATVFFSPNKIIGLFCGDLLGLQQQSLATLLSQYPLYQAHEILIASGDAKRFFNLQIKPLVKQLDTSYGIMLILSDITCIVDHRQVLEQKVHERTVALSSSEKLLGALFHAVGKGILLIDSEGEIVKANQKASEIYGRPLEILIGTHLCHLTDQLGCATLRQAKEELIEGNQFQGEITSLYVDGKVFPSVVTMTRMILDDRPYWTLIVRDITEQKALELNLREEKQHAEEMNVTLRNVLKSIEDDRRGFESTLTEHISTSILPGIEKIQAEKNEEVRQGYLTLLKDQLISLTRGFDSELDGDLLKLTKKELKICQFIKAGLSGKEICETMNLSFETIQTHRKNIRRKLGLRGREQGLHQFLANKNCDF